ncbi:cytochrome b [Azospira inquinata]|uniref:Cytochrome b n=1 Tax=Azospira inquinata TaxID=2785627 RepID=A0A975SLN6_9RHOO|nr:cytochrome b [Azospira inquinata]QWT46541.1 cytochrome b [Azospira inquinata]QWT48134.1 cytochrome b [Azospira inquinata]
MTHQRYTAPAIALHWLVALGMLGAFVVGVYMHDLPLSPWKLKIYSYHKWVGVTVFLLALIRILWRLTHRPPVLPLTMPLWQRVAAEGMHHLLYLLMFAIPLTGWLMSSAKGFQTVYLGLVPLPDLLAKNPTLGDQLKEVHEALNFLMIALVAGHAGAAIKHHLVDKDDVLTRMLPFHK